MVKGLFFNGKVNGNIEKYISEGDIYCDEKNTLLDTRIRYINANKFNQVCENGVVTSSTSLPKITLRMEWNFNNLKSIEIIEHILDLSQLYVVDSENRINSLNLISLDKNDFLNEVYA